jgi:hypothetical protein
MEKLLNRADARTVRGVIHFMDISYFDFWLLSN